jgi:hypothetical protein
LLQPKLPIGTALAVPTLDAEHLAPYALFLERLEAGEAIDERTARLVDAAIATSMRPGFEQFVSLSHLRFVPFPHQLAAARRALTRLRGRAILADEVGLGKTIEACLVLSELSFRRLVRRTLILVPPGLVEQWVEEIDRKFALPSYRLNVMFAPALAFAVNVRRGERRYPLTLHWLLAAGSFAMPRCPNCGAFETLFAGRTQLRCRQCAPSASG